MRAGPTKNREYTFLMKRHQIKIATWNVGRPKPSTKPRNESILKTLHGVDADILVLTETNSCIDLRDIYQTCFSTACLFESLALGGELYKEGENRVTIWSKFSGQRRIDMSNSHSSVCALLESDWGDLNVYGTVIGIYGKNRGRYERKLSKTDFETAIETQLIDWERLAGLGDLCIVGDFNTELSLSGKDYVSASGRKRINECFQKIDVQVPTRGIPNNVDHVALSANFLKSIDPPWKTWNEAKDKTLLSDHVGVSITLQRP
jgi:endonuclease/exonuclease/phosphatase family metal-dependent hydrolase